nr:hypothetical protein [Paenibacillus bovis]
MDIIVEVVNVGDYVVGIIENGGDLVGGDGLKLGVHSDGLEI